MLADDDVESSVLQESKVICESALRDFTPAQVAVAFNGGKDSVVMLDILFDAVGSTLARQCFFFAFVDDDEFPEIKNFRSEQAKHYGFEICFVSAASQRDGLWALYSERGIRAAFLGSRQSDPSGAWLKQPVMHCTEGWPDIILYCPLLRWSVTDVWKYTLRRNLPYCNLYLKGYSSIGSRSQTSPNPALFCHETASYRPAWELQDPTLERWSRQTSPASQNSSSRL